MARIAVIGAGMGAMAAAARLAVAGHRVTVYERSSTYGGAVRRFERDGFAFDTGPGLLQLPAVYRDLFVKTGREPLEKCVELVQVDPASRHLFADGSDVLLPNASRAGVVAALDAALGGGAGARWGEFLDRARVTWDRTRRPLLEEPLPADPAPLGDDPYPALRTGLLRRSASTLAEVGSRELRDPRLAALLGSYALSYGFDPLTVPASAAVLPYMEQTFGNWYVRGGMRALADAVYQRCLARRVEFVFGSEVVDVTEKDGRACGLELADGQRVVADQVVAGAPVRSVSWPQREAGPRTGRVVVCLALRGERPADAVHRTVVHRADEDLPMVTVLRPGDPELVPGEGHEALTLTVTVPVTDGAADEVPPGFADRVVAAAEAAVPGLRERVLWREVRTPADTLRETGTLRVPGPALAGAHGQLLPAPNRSPLSGLSFVGGWSHPGGGLPHAGMSGALAAGLIVEGEGFRGSQ
ncbi:MULTISPECIES: NAD(P)/FAD-dependent oxidoreductase [unclassified Streptomyces]|uniref:phytoene desaturase family protein n=1 Tax=unclassified Streptomyces TaxID=2593676 RepID=UPI002023C408|nr:MULTISPECIES: NAD(P)/FAD-dependent oxidoreductase [unclassified Streptomyces]MCX4551622.1 NAD(P)/FAD-dependent oxidoreductase [Streptomyces sp. NBC_01500]WSC23005.1 NAD(P)/FAD-dependent oxidoreductase [Streptomyces sp. NBC_01766]WSV56916.1 NAD(P)/FAD-dependent oxidoreductase [Streptomyces sp. NBC_01014]